MVELCGKVRHGQGKNQFSFGLDLHPGADPGIFNDSSTLRDRVVVFFTIFLVFLFQK